MRTTISRLSPADLDLSTLTEMYIAADFVGCARLIGSTNIRAADSPARDPKRDWRLWACHLGVASRDLAKDAAEVSAADFADIVRREALEQHLADPTFGGAFDLPFLALAEDAALRQQIIGV